MNREKFKELLPCITAFANGETIQIRNASGYWVDALGDEVAFTHDPYFYRVKPKEVKVERTGVINLGAEPGTDPWVTSFPNKRDADDFIRREGRGRNLLTFPLTGSYER